MSKQTVLEKIRTDLLALTPINSDLTQLMRVYAYPYDAVPEPVTEFPSAIVERRRPLPAFSEAIGSNGNYEELLPIRIDIVFKEYKMDTDRPNIDAADEKLALMWEDELHAFFANNTNLSGVIIKFGKLGEARRVETRIGRRYWFTQELFGVAAFVTALYEVTTA